MNGGAPRAHGRDCATIIGSMLEDGRGLWVSREGMYGEPRPPEWRVQGGFA